MEHRLFSTFVYQDKIKFDLKDLKQEILQIQKADEKGLEWSKNNYLNGYTSYSSFDQLHRMSSTFESLQKKIDSHVNKYIKSLNYEISKNSLCMQNFWINIMPTNTIHTAHIHPQSVISGTYYVEIPKNASVIKFEDPRLGFFMNAPSVKQNSPKEFQRFYSIEPKNGDVVLFESWLKHEVPLNRAKTSRISVSFNYGWN